MAAADRVGYETKRDPMAYNGDEQVAPPIVQRQAMTVMKGTSI